MAEKTQSNPPDAVDVARSLGDLARSVLDRVGPATVAIGRDARGAGVVVAPGRVLTNAHHMRDRTTQVVFADGRREQGQVVGSDPHGDLVVLDVDTAAAPALEWSGTAASPGDCVFSVDRSHRGVRLSLGLVSGTDRELRGPSGRRLAGAIEHGATLGRGATGGPLVAADGTVVGINTHRLPDGSVLALAADDDLRSRVGSMAGGEDVRRPVLGVALAGPDVAGRLRRAVGLDDRSGLLVRDVDPDGIAAAAGVSEGDLLVAVDGEQLDSISALAAALDRAAPDASVTLSLVRGAEELEVVVDLTPPGPPAAGT